MRFCHRFGEQFSEFSVHTRSNEAIVVSDSSDGCKCICVSGEEEVANLFLRDAQAVKLRDDLLRLFPLNAIDPDDDTVLFAEAVNVEAMEDDDFDEAIHADAVEVLPGQTVCGKGVTS